MNPLNVDCSRKNLATILSMVVVVVLALILRLQMIEHSVVDHPIRADASQYYHYAVNLKQHGIYSMSRPNQDGVPPVADAHRNPGYALFIYPYVEFPPTLQMVYKVEMVQVLLSALTILLMASAMKSVLGLRLSICLGCLIALSPHLVSANIYLLTECLFTFLLALMAFLFSRFISRKNLLYMVLFGVTLAVALLVRPTMKYFLIFLVPAFFFIPAIGDAKRKSAAILFVLLSFAAVYSPWVIRNALNDPVKSTLAIDTIHKGMYPGLMYKDDPRSLGVPNHVDPGWKERETTSQVLEEIASRFESEPIRHLEWYLFGKTATFLSWSIIAGAGDIYIYPTPRSPYKDKILFYSTYNLMKVLHWPLMILSLAAMVGVWLPSARKLMTDNAIAISRLCSLMMLYFIAVHAVGTPLPRYSIPIRPYTYSMAVLAMLLVYKGYIYYCEKKEIVDGAVEMG